MSNETEEITTTDVDVPHAPAAPAKLRERTTGGQTYADRYLTPLMLPLVAVGMILFYVLNVSRVLISGKGTIAIVVAAIITVSILAGASTLSAAPKMRSNTMAVFMGVVLLVVLFAGLVAVGHAQEKKESVVAACTPVGVKVSVIAKDSVAFDKSSYTAKAGCVEIDYGGAAGHTFQFQGTGPAEPVLHSDNSGAQKYAWDLQPGTYTFICTVSGHAATMHATLVVS